MAKKMVLVDEQVYNNMKPNNLLNYMKTKEQNDMWQKSPVETTKSHLNSRLQSQLSSDDLSDDVKAKLYQKTLKRFLSLRQKVPDLEPTALNGLTTPPVKTLKRKATQWSDFDSPPAIKRKVVTRRSQRKHIPWSRFGNE